MDPAETHKTQATQGVLLSQHKQTIKILFNNAAALLQFMAKLSQQMARTLLWARNMLPLTLLVSLRAEDQMSKELLLWSS